MGVGCGVLSVCCGMCDPECVVWVGASWWCWVCVLGWVAFGVLGARSGLVLWLATTCIHLATKKKQKNYRALTGCRLFAY